MNNASSLFASTKNTRAILPGSFRYIRSDVPVSMTKEEIEWLISRNVGTVIDLRTKEEIGRKPCCLSADKRFTYLNMPVTGGDKIPDSQEHVAESYFLMTDGRMLEIIRTVENAKTNVLFFCNAGKDRTGVVSALLLRNMGFDDEYIIDDYLKSADNLKEMLLAYQTSHSDIDLDVITPQRKYIENFLNRIELRNDLTDGKKEEHKGD